MDLIAEMLLEILTDENETEDAAALDDALAARCMCL